MNSELVEMYPEKALIEKNIQGLNSFVLIAPPNSGKSSLLNNTIQEALSKEKIISVSLNLLFSISEEDFYCKYSSEILSSLTVDSPASVDSYLHILSKLKLPLEVESNNERFNVALQKNDTGLTIEEKAAILNLPEQLAIQEEIKIVVSLTEFHSLLSWGTNSQDFISLLGLALQNQKNVVYCLSGSHIHHMNSLFTKKSSALYGFCTIINLKKFPGEKLTEFIAKQVRNSGKEITLELINLLLKVTDHSIFYSDYLVTEILKSNKKVIDRDLVISCIEQLLTSYVAFYKSRFSRYSINQRLLLIALAKYKGSKIYSLEFIRMSGLEYSAKLDKVKNSLLKDGSIYSAEDKTITFSDPMFKYWLEVNFDNPK